ncbi:MAG: DUF374 domain-containing protein [Planctomycetales bacterium]|nr:DUF374 domain-containing protein [Planctomycetales bacterium]
MKFRDWVIAWSSAFAILMLRATCRIHLHGDPRPELRAAAQSYVYAVLHAHQVAAVIDGERGTGAMVSRSADGGILIPALRLRGIIPIRGSSNRTGQDRGGLAALDALIEHVVGGSPAYLAVDGPRGPRNHVHKGIAVLSQRSHAVVINVIPVPTRRWILTGAWDRLQIPKPFSTINVFFGKPLSPEEGEGVEPFCMRIEAALNELEQAHDPIEAGLSREHCFRRRDRQNAESREPKP